MSGSGSQAIEDGRDQVRDGPGTPRRAAITDTRDVDTRLHRVAAPADLGQIVRHVELVLRPVWLEVRQLEGAKANRDLYVYVVEKVRRRFRSVHIAGARW